MKLDKNDTAVVMIDPQNEVLSETGLGWPLLRESLHENNTVENMERIFQAAKEFGFEIFISPHYFYPTDKGWKFNGALEADEAASGMFSRKGVLNLDGLEGSGADWLKRFKPYIEDGKTIVVAPHRVFGPETNDLVLQLRKRRISRVILGGMLANMCTAAPKHPEWGYNYTAALINLRVPRTCSADNGSGRECNEARVKERHTRFRNVRREIFVLDKGIS